MRFDSDAICISLVQIRAQIDYPEILESLILYVALHGCETCSVITMVLTEGVWEEKLNKMLQDERQEGTKGYSILHY
jgi:hypothetical protein